MKTLAVRIDDALHEQLNLVASLNGENVTSAIRSAIAEYITSHKDKVREKAEEARADAASHMESGVAPSPGVDPMNRRLAGTGKAS